MWVSHQELNQLIIDINGIRQEINKLQEQLEKVKETVLPSAELKSRVIELEMWQTKIHTLITEKDKRGNDKLNKMGRNLAGRSLNSL